MRPVLRSHDAWAILGLLALTAFHIWRRLVPLTEHLIGDWVSLFLPQFTHLGQRLRMGDVPAWNPAQFAGTPFAADPQSGWGNALAMLWFSLLPTGNAWLAYNAASILIAVLSTYVLARLLGLGALACFAAAASYGFGWITEMSKSSPPYLAVAVWLPVMLLGLELALRAPTWRSRVLWSALAGFGTSQVIAGFFGQGAYYAILVAGAYLLVRGVLAPIDPATVWRDRFRQAAGVGLFTSLTGFGFSALLVLPALEYNPRSSLAGGVYGQLTAWELGNVSHTANDLVLRMLGGYAGGHWDYLGLTLIVLAAVAPLVARAWRTLPLWLMIGLVAPILALADATPLHRLFGAVLPGFDLLHGHHPARVMMVALLPLTLLAAATIDYLPRYRPRLPRDAVLVMLPALAILAITLLGPALVLTPTVRVAAALTTILVALPLVLRTPFARSWAPVGLALALLLDPAGRIVIAGFDLPQRAPEVVAALVTGTADPPGAARFLASAPPGAGRYFGYSPANLPDYSVMTTGAPLPFAQLGLGHDPLTTALLINNTASVYGLEDVQGYNPTQIQRYVDYVDASNGHPQDYHESAIFPAALQSPLFPLLSVSYIVTTPEEAGEVLAGLPGARITYRDESSTVIALTSTLPRAWLVHEARQAAPADVLPLLADGTIDPGRTVILESSPPPLTTPSPDLLATESASLVSASPERLTYSVEAAAAGMLVLSEIYDPNWTATVNGAPAPIYPANHAFRAIPIPAGAHMVELTYVPVWLRVGLAVTTGTVLGVLGLAATAAWAALRPRRNHAPEAASA